MKRLFELQERNVVERAVETRKLDDGIATLMRQPTLCSVKVIDADTHLLETRTLWADHLPAGRRDLALRIADDELGYAWLTAPDGRRIHLAEAQAPGDVPAMGAYRARQHRGGPAPARFEEAVAPHDIDPWRASPSWIGRGSTRPSCFPTSGCFGSVPSKISLLRNSPTWRPGTGGPWRASDPAAPAVCGR